MMTTDIKLDFPELTFEEDRHIYKLNGVQIPSVTTVMRPLSNELYRTVDEDVLNRAADRGTAVHNAIENYYKFGIADIDPRYESYFNAFNYWYKDVNPEVLESECRLYHKFLLYAGTADMLVVIDGKVILVDFKTSASVNKMLTGVQLEAYSKACESHGINIDGKAILHLKKNGKYDWHYYDKNDAESWECFGALMVVRNHIKKYR